MQPEVGAIGVAGDVATSAVALAGLILVFLGATAAGFDTYERIEKNAVRGRYQRRAWFSYVGFLLSLLSAILAIIAKWLHNECLAAAAIWALFATFLWVAVAAIIVVRDIK